MAQLFLNNAYSTLAGPVLATDTAILVKNPEGFPSSLAAGDWFYLTVLSESGRYGENIEIVKVTAVASATGGQLEFTVTRGQDGTTAVAHEETEKAQARINAGMLRELLRAAQDYSDANVAALLDAAPGALDTLNELAAALGDDPNFATTMTNALADKLDTTSYTAADVLAKLLTVDGSGSGLDADTVRGKVMGTAAEQDVGTASGNVMPVGAFGLGGISLPDDALNERNPASLFRNDDRTNNYAYGQQVSVLSLPYVGGRSAELALSISSDQIFWRTQRTTDTWSDTYELWHSGNDGTGSGLDADTVDGKHAGDFVAASSGVGSGIHLSKYQYFDDYDDGAGADTGLRCYVRDGQWNINGDTGETNPIGIKVAGQTVWHAGNLDPADGAFLHYDLAVNDTYSANDTTSADLDLSTGPQVAIVGNGSLRTVNLLNPPAGRSILVIVFGTGAAGFDFTQLPSAGYWDGGKVPEVGQYWTQYLLWWSGSFWRGGVGIKR